VLCAFKRFGEINPRKAALRVTGEFPAPGVYHVSVCSQCGVCADVCPVEAISVRDGVYVIDAEVCTGCQQCVDECPEGVMFVHKDEIGPIKCDLCGECVEICPRTALALVEG